MAPRTRHEATFPAWIGWTALAFASALAVLLCVFPAMDFDLWWHLRTGRLIVETAKIPHADPFTYTAAGRPWVTHEWLAEVIFHLLDRLGGINLLILFKACLAGSALALSAWAGLTDRNGSMRRALPAAALGVLVAAPLLSPRAFIRPHMMSALLLAVTLLLLRRRTSTRREAYRWALVPLFVLWANLHSGFVLGLGLVFLYWLGEMMEARAGRSETTPSWRRNAAAFALLVAAVTLLNPNHVRALLYPLQLLKVSGAKENIAELTSIFRPAYRGALFLKSMFLACALLAAGFGADLIRSRTRQRWSLLLPAAFFLALALHSLRGVSEFAVVLPAVIAAQGAILGAHRRIAASVSWIVIALAIAGGAATIRWGQPMGQDPPRRVGLGVDPVNCPELASRFLREVAPPGRIFNVMPFGGYLINSQWPARQVFIDGRLDVSPPGFFESYLEMMSSGAGWDDAVARYGIAFAVVDYNDTPENDLGLRARLRQDPDWVCVCYGDNVVVYARRLQANADILKRFGTPFDPSEQSDSSIDRFLSHATPAERDQAIYALRNIAVFASNEKAPWVVLGVLLDHAGRQDEAIEPLRKAVRLDPANRKTTLQLVRAMIHTGSLDDARRELTPVLQRTPVDVDAWIVLSELERSAGRLRESAEALRRAAASDPASYLAHLRLGIAEAELGHYLQARSSFGRALEIRPGDPAALKDLDMLRNLEGKR